MQPKLIDEITNQDNKNYGRKNFTSQRQGKNATGDFQE
jgi:hypothetical protein